MIKKRERGASRLVTLIVLIVLGVLVFIGVKIVPVYFANYEFQDTIQTEWRFAEVNRRSQEDLLKVVFRRAKSLDIPIREDQIRVEKTSQGFAISAKYSVTVDLQYYQFTVDFNPTSGS